MIRKVSFLFAFLLISILGFSQLETEILWESNYKLKWEDFQAKPQMGHRASALTNASTQFYLQQEGSVLKIDTRVFFRKNGSWVKPDALKDNLLQHEQTHFDIYELYARQFRQIVASFDTNKHPQKLVDKLAKLYKKYQIKAKKTQAKYDKQTNFSRNLESQKVWSNKINLQLKQLDKFSHPFLEIKI